MKLNFSRQFPVEWSCSDIGCHPSLPQEAGRLPNTWPTRYSTDWPGYIHTDLGGQGDYLHTNGAGRYRERLWVPGLVQHGVVSSLDCNMLQNTESLLSTLIVTDHQCYRTIKSLQTTLHSNTIDTYNTGLYMHYGLLLRWFSHITIPHLWVHMSHRYIPFYW